MGKSKKQIETVPCQRIWPGNLLKTALPCLRRTGVEWGGEGRTGKTKGNVCGGQDQVPLVHCSLSLKSPASCPFSPSPSTRAPLRTNVPLQAGTTAQVPEITVANPQGLMSRVSAWRALLNPFQHFWKEFKVNSSSVGGRPAQRNPGFKS